ncbi:MAG TPA: hypothetical protein VHX40_07560, partial [Acidimicrobiales bacterium]|nr:hypothetical protein [Acidimicrobiales bacterium]
MLLVKIPQSPPDQREIVGELGNDTDALRRLVVARAGPVDPKGRYLHWEDMRSRTPPDDLTRKEW